MTGKSISHAIERKTERKQKDEAGGENLKNGIKKKKNRECWGGRAHGEGQECRLCLTAHSLPHQGVRAAADILLSDMLMYGAALKNNGFICPRSCRAGYKKRNTRGDTWCRIGRRYKSTRVTEHVYAQDMPSSTRVVSIHMRVYCFNYHQALKSIFMIIIITVLRYISLSRDNYCA